MTGPKVPVIHVAPDGRFTSLLYRTYAFANSWNCFRVAYNAAVFDGAVRRFFPPDGSLAMPNVSAHGKRDGSA